MSVSNPAEHYSAGQSVRAHVASIDADTNRLSLSLKPSATKARALSISVLFALPRISLAFSNCVISHLSFYVCARACFSCSQASTEFAAAYATSYFAERAFMVRVRQLVAGAHLSLSFRPSLSF